MSYHSRFWKKHYPEIGFCCITRPLEYVPVLNTVNRYLTDYIDTRWMVQARLKWVGLDEDGFVIWIDSTGKVYRFDDLKRNAAGIKYEKEVDKLVLGDGNGKINVDLEWEVEIQKQCGFCPPEKDGGSSGGRVDDDSDKINTDDNQSTSYPAGSSDPSTYIPAQDNWSAQTSAPIKPVTDASGITDLSDVLSRDQLRGNPVTQYTIPVSGSSDDEARKKAIMYMAKPVFSDVKIPKTDFSDVRPETVPVPSIPVLYGKHVVDKRKVISKLPKADIGVYITRNGRLDRKRYIDAPLDEDYVPEHGEDTTSSSTNKANKIANKFPSTPDTEPNFFDVMSLVRIAVFDATFDHTQGYIADAARRNSARTSDFKENFRNYILQENVFKGKDPRNWKGSEVNALKHTVWQASLTTKYSTGTAKWYGDAHEQKDEGDTVESKLDREIDKRNNKIGRMIGRALPKGIDVKTVLNDTLDYFHEVGLWVFKKDAEGKVIGIEQKPLEESRYQEMKRLFSRLDKNGYLPQDK